MGLNVAKIQARFKAVQTENAALTKRIRGADDQKRIAVQVERQLATEPLLQQIRALKAQLRDERRVRVSLERELERLLTPA